MKKNNPWVRLRAFCHFVVARICLANQYLFLIIKMWDDLDLIMARYRLQWCLAQRSCVVKSLFLCIYIYRGLKPFCGQFRCECCQVWNFCRTQVKILRETFWFVWIQSVALDFIVTLSSLSTDDKQTVSFWFSES